MELFRSHWPPGSAVCHRDRAGAAVVSGTVRPDRDVGDFHGGGAVISRQRVWGSFDPEARRDPDGYLLDFLFQYCHGTHGGRAAVRDCPLDRRVL